MSESIKETAAMQIRVFVEVLAEVLQGLLHLLLELGGGFGVEGLFDGIDGIVIMIVRLVMLVHCGSPLKMKKGFQDIYMTSTKTLKV